MTLSSFCTTVIDLLIFFLSSLSLSYASYVLKHFKPQATALSSPSQCFSPMTTRNTVYSTSPLRATHSIPQNQYPKFLEPAAVMITITMMKKKHKIAICKDRVDNPFLTPFALIRVKCAIAQTQNNPTTAACRF